MRDHRHPTAALRLERMAALILLRIAIAGLGLALLAACSAVSTPQPTAAPPTPAPTPAPTLTPTPVPQLLLIAAAEPAAGEALRTLAAERGWQMRHAAPQEAAAALEEPGSEIRAAVVYDTAPAGLPQVPTVLVDVPGAAPQATVSTVGEPGARHDQAGFLAGVMVGLAAQVEWVGQVTGVGAAHAAEYQAGFEQGLKVGCPRCRLVSLSLEEATVDRFRAQGVQVVFVPPAPEALPLATALGQAGLWLVWIGELPEDFPVAALAGRVAFDSQPLVVPALQALLGGSAGQAWSYTIENGGIVLADVNEQAISPGRQRLLQEAYQAVATGELDIGLGQP